MSNKGIRANTTGTSNVGGDITGTTSGDKYALDVNVVSNAESNCDLVARIDDASATVTYKGWAQPGSSPGDSVWRIARFTISGTQVIEELADGNRNFDNEWDNRASLSYS